MPHPMCLLGDAAEIFSQRPGASQWLPASLGEDLTGILSPTPASQRPVMSKASPCTEENPEAWGGSQLARDSPASEGLGFERPRRDAGAPPPSTSLLGHPVTPAGVAGGVSLSC